ncbi:MAG: hypothetical protein EA380_11575 [Phycisphaeraceae bacterium]|nr:MAG: hypothetical protein EA380_11575 [Phycisphaeraceae bacterium]
MKTVFSAAAVLAIAGAASAAPFNVNGIAVGDSLSPGGLTASTAFSQSSAYGTLAGNIVAQAGVPWNQFRNSGQVGASTFLGARGGVAPDWTTVLPAQTPGGTHIGDDADFLDADFSLQTTPTLNNFGWARLTLGTVTSAQGDIGFGPSELVWLGQFNVIDGGDFGGDVTVIFAGTPALSYSVNGAGVTGPTGETLWLVSVLQGTRQGNNVYDMYLTNVIPAPGAFALLGLGGLAAMRRRR